MTKLLAQAGGCGQDSRTKSPQVTARASDALNISGHPPICGDTGPPARALIRCQTAHPDAIPAKWPRMTDRGAADSEVGVARFDERKAPLFYRCFHPAGEIVPA